MAQPQKPGISGARMTQPSSQDAEPQDATFAFLADPATHGGHQVKRIDTHAASVFLAGDRVLKVKRAVRFPFLDYSTLDLRRAACEAELEVNRPFAPEIYRRVVPITREADGSLALAGKGQPVEWAVEMRRFDEESTLDHLADAGKIDLALADMLGRTVAAAHRAMPVVAAGPWIEALASFLDQNKVAFDEVPELFPVEKARALDAASRSMFARIRPLLVERGKLGLIRRTHGDLHLGNIALIDGRPVMFDAIEFDPVIASGDVLYDLAFLLMDLIERGLGEAANIVLNRYFAETRRLEDLDALVGLPFFLSMRAAIRAKVTAARRVHAPASERGGIERAARTYFQLACRLIAPPAPRLVAVGGLSGTGKSVLARMLAPAIDPAPGAVLLRSDVERKALCGVAETEKLPPDGYRPDVTAKVYATLAAKARRVIAAGHSAVVDAVFARADERAAIAAAAHSAQTSFRGLYLTAAVSVRLARVGGRARDASDADAKVVLLQESYDIGAMDWTEVNASGTPQETLERAKAALAD
jgi:aminoglycoside phosphotransferase family enzyme/predicted kinase